MTDDWPPDSEMHKLRKAVNKATRAMTDAHCPADARAQDAIAALDRVIEHAEAAQEQLE